MEHDDFTGFSVSGIFQVATIIKLYMLTATPGLNLWYIHLYIWLVLYLLFHIHLIKMNIINISKIPFKKLMLTWEKGIQFLTEYHFFWTLFHLEILSQIGFYSRCMKYCLLYRGGGTSPTETIKWARQGSGCYLYR